MRLKILNYFTQAIQIQQLINFFCVDTACSSCFYQVYIIFISSNDSYPVLSAFITYGCTNQYQEFSSLDVQRDNSPFHKSTEMSENIFMSQIKVPGLFPM